MKISPVFAVLIIVLFCGALFTGCSSVITGPARSTYSTEAIELDNKGFDAFTGGNNETALSYYNQALAADPAYTRAWINKGDLLARLNRSEEAVASYDAALSLEPELPLVLNSRGEALMSLGRYNDALDSFEKAVSYAPEFTEAKENRDAARLKIQGAAAGGATTGTK